MTDALNLQAAEGETPDEAKRSNNSYFICHNSRQSNFACWRP